MAIKENPYKRGNYNLIMGFILTFKGRPFTKSQVIKHAIDQLGMTELTANASVGVVMSPSKSSERGDCRGNWSSQGHLYYLVKVNRNVTKNEDGKEIKEEQRYQMRWRNPELEPFKRQVNLDPVEIEAKAEKKAEKKAKREEKAKIKAEAVSLRKEVRKAKKDAAILAKVEKKEKRIAAKIAKAEVAKAEAEATKIAKAEIAKGKAEVAEIEGKAQEQIAIASEVETVEVETVEVETVEVETVEVETVEVEV